MARSLTRLALLVLTLVSGTALGAMAWSPAGATTADNTYTTVTPCAAYDSRTGTGLFAGPHTVNQTRTVQITGTTIPAAQGGGFASCGVPAGADAVLVNVVAINATEAGNLRASAAGVVANGGIVNFANLTGEKLNTSNTVAVPLSTGGAIDLNTNCGTATCQGNPATPVTQVRAVVLGYFSDDLAARVAALETLLADVTRVPDAGVGAVGGKDTLRFSGMNVQIVDGTGSTACNDATPGGFDSACNGLGNVVIGYAEGSDDGSRTGSHNLVTGSHNAWTSYGGAVFGRDNRIRNDYATITGGNNNEALARLTHVSGGHDNHANGEWATVTGGMGNEAKGLLTSITGGRDNTAEGEWSSVSGGQEGTSIGTFSSVSGGSLGQATGVWSSVSGGSLGKATGDWSSVSGGDQGTASGDYSSVSGGGLNVALGDYSSVSGGGTNHANGLGASVSGGQDNVAAGLAASISGGLNRVAPNQWNWSGGGLTQPQ